MYNKTTCSEWIVCAYTHNIHENFLQNTENVFFTTFACIQVVLTHVDNVFSSKQTTFITDLLITDQFITYPLWTGLLWTWSVFKQFHFSRVYLCGEKQCFILGRFMLSPPLPVPCASERNHDRYRVAIQHLRVGYPTDLNPIPIWHLFHSTLSQHNSNFNHNLVGHQRQIYGSKLPKGVQMEKLHGLQFFCVPKYFPSSLVKNACFPQWSELSEWKIFPKTFSVSVKKVHSNWFST